MARFGLVGPTYQSQSPIADLEECINLYPEIDEGQGKSAMSLYSTPGLSLFSALATKPVRGIIYVQYPNGPSLGACFAVSGNTLYQILSSGAATTLGTVGNDGQVVSMAFGSVGAGLGGSLYPQLAICSAGNLYVLNCVSLALQQIPGSNFPQGPLAKVDYGDGFFIITYKNSNYFQTSNPGDATNWPALSLAQVTVFPENIVSTMVDHRYLWLFGQKKSQVYVDAGMPFTPYEVIPGALLEIGSFAANSAAKLDNSIFILGGDERGAGMFWRTSGYSLVRISNHAIETLIQSFPTYSDCVGYAYQDQGHSFYVAYFPTANKTLVYDVATGLWHKREYWNEGTPIAHLSQCHAFAFGKHLVGDWNSGNVYQMAIPSVSGGAWNFVTDNGNPIRRTRISPPISTENRWIYHNSLQIDVEVGLGPMPPLRDGLGKPRGPQMLLSWIDNGKIHSNEHALDCGQSGQYLQRAIYRRLGRSRMRNYKIQMTDPVPFRLIEGYLEATGFQPTERLVKQLGKAA